jgi:hypothetical protein
MIVVAVASFLCVLMLAVNERMSEVVNEGVRDAKLKEAETPRVIVAPSRPQMKCGGG